VSRIHFPMNPRHSLRGATLRDVNRISRAAVIAGLCVPLLTGCYNGFNAQTAVAPAGGDASTATVGVIKVTGANWVRSDKTPANLTLVANIANLGQQADALKAVTTVPAEFGGQSGITNGSIAVAPLSESQIGWNSTNFVNAYGIAAPDSGYVTTTFVFEKAGSVSVPVLVVPSSGNYEGIEPNPEKALTPPTNATNPIPGATSAAEAPRPPSVFPPSTEEGAHAAAKGAGEAGKHAAEAASGGNNPTPAAH